MAGNEAGAAAGGATRWSSGRCAQTRRQRRDSTLVRAEADQDLVQQRVGEAADAVLLAGAGTAAAAAAAAFAVD